MMSTSTADAACTRPSFDEQQVVAMVQRGNRAAFGLLVREHQRLAYTVCRAVLDTHEDAEDAVQDGFFNAFRAIDRFQSGQPFGAWLHRIMANAARDLRRRRSLRQTDELPPDVAADTLDPCAEMTRTKLLSAALQALPERQRATVVLHELEGFTHAEIADMLGVAEGTAKYDLHTARRTLRERLGRYREDL